MSSPIQSVEGGGFFYELGVHVSLTEDMATRAILPTVITERLVLKVFTEKNVAEYQQIFGGRIVVRKDFDECSKFYCNDEAMKDYGKRRADTPQELQKRLEVWGGRPLKGDPYTGFAIVELETNEIIGTVSLGHSAEAGVAQCGLVIRPDKRGQRFAKEVAVAVGALALALFKAQKPLDGKPLEAITATTLNTNERMIQLITAFGMEKIGPVKDDNSRSLYSISSGKLEEQMKKIMDISRITFIPRSGQF